MTGFTQTELEKWLTPRPVRFFEQIGSTNDAALEWLREGAPVGAVVVTNDQTGGRGRKGRSWYTPPGSALILSVVLRPELSRVPQVTMLGAVAIYDLLTHLGVADVGIKWPNDVQINGLKVSGVLPEAIWEGSSLLGIALGMGINVSIDFSGTELAQTAISIEPALNRQIDRAGALVYLLARIDYWYARLGSGDVFDAWRERLTTLGKAVVLENGAVRGVAERVDAAGALVVRDADGELHRVIAGDIALGT
jgi:BirA family biotin operon repressor/biotin-[acetyl-CoA-carboxylase] ligase